MSVSHHRCIAVVDGNESILTAVSRLLRAYEFNVYPFASGQDFLNSARRSCTSCVLMESDLPGSSCLDDLRKLKRCADRLPVIVMGTRDGSEARNQCISAGAEEYLHMPFDAAILIGTIARALQSAPPS